MLQNGYSELKKTDVLALAGSNGYNRAAFTLAEHGTANVVFGLAQLYAVHSANPSYPSSAITEFLRQLFENLELWLIKSSAALHYGAMFGKYASMPLAPDLKIPIWSLYHELFSHLEQCKFVSLTLSYTLAENKKRALIDQKWLLGRVNALQTECTSLAAKVSRAAIAVQDRLQGEAFLERFEKVVLDGAENDQNEAMIVRELESLGRSSEMKRVCKELRDSWIDGLEGIVQTKAT